MLEQYNRMLKYFLALNIGLRHTEAVDLGSTGPGALFLTCDRIGSAHVVDS